VAIGIIMWLAIKKIALIVPGAIKTVPGNNPTDNEAGIPMKKVNIHKYLFGFIKQIINIIKLI